MRLIAAGVFKAKCLAIMDEVQAKRTSVVITKNGKPVARLVPIKEEQDDLFGFYAGKLELVGEIDSPAVAEDDWKRLA